LGVFAALKSRVSVEFTGIHVAKRIIGTS
jgi:hypothetical protein